MQVLPKAPKAIIALAKEDKLPKELFEKLEFFDANGGLQSPLVVGLCQHYRHWTPQAVRRILRTTHFRGSWLFEEFSKNQFLSPDVVFVLFQTIRQSYPITTILSKMLTSFSAYATSSEIVTEVVRTIIENETIIVPGPALHSALEPWCKNFTQSDWSKFFLVDAPARTFALTCPHLPTRYYSQIPSLEGAHLAMALLNNPEAINSVSLKTLLSISPKSLIKVRTLRPDLALEIDTRLVSTKEGITALAESSVTPLVPVSTQALAALLAKGNHPKKLVASIPRLTHRSV